MKFQASAEVHKPASEALFGVRRRIFPFLSRALERGTLEHLDATLLYVPVVMPQTMHARYPARSKLKKKQRVYECCPILNYDVFVGGQLQDQIQEYLRGIALSLPHLASIGASPDQINEFEAIIAGIAEQVLVEGSEQTRH